MNELTDLEHKLKVSRRIIASEARTDEDPIVHSMIVEELKLDVPRLERRVRQLQDFGGPNRRDS